jgi:hypothetical protein
LLGAIRAGRYMSHFFLGECCGAALALLGWLWWCSR